MEVFDWLPGALFGMKRAMEQQMEDERRRFEQERLRLAREQARRQCQEDAGWYEVPIPAPLPPPTPKSNRLAEEGKVSKHYDYEFRDGTP